MLQQVTKSLAKVKIQTEQQFLQHMKHEPNDAKHFFEVWSDQNKKLYCYRFLANVTDLEYLKRLKETLNNLQADLTDEAAKRNLQKCKATISEQQNWKTLKQYKIQQKNVRKNLFKELINYWKITDYDKDINWIEQYQHRLIQQTIKRLQLFQLSIQQMRNNSILETSIREQHYAQEMVQLQLQWTKMKEFAIQIMELRKANRLNYIVRMLWGCIHLIILHSVGFFIVSCLGIVDLSEYISVSYIFEYFSKMILVYLGGIGITKIVTYTIFRQERLFDPIERDLIDKLANGS